MSNPTLSHLSILIVDDLSAARLLLKTILRGFGIAEVVEASDGAAALEVLKTKRVDVIVTDMSMKPMDGIEFTRRLRRPDNGLDPYVPVLMISAHTEAACVIDALSAGVTAFLTKPLTPAAVEAKLHAIINAQCRFVRTPTYCGPDRRRRSMKIRNGRRATDGEVTAI